MRTPLRLLLAVATAATLLVLVPGRADAAPLDDVDQLSSRSQLNCVATADGRARCWGDGEDGQLGYGGTDDQALAVTVVNADTGSALTGVVQVAAGRDHACARLQNKRVRCWGSNVLGQLGDGTTDQRLQAVLVQNPAGTGPLLNVTQVTVGAHHSCARVVSGQLRCWGMNSFGQLGTGTTTHSPRPKVVRSTSGAGALTKAAQVVAGERHTCARRANGQVRCWGDNAQGQLGDGTTSDRLLPGTVVAVTGPGALTGVTQVASGNEHVCARLGNGQARCWGNDGSGRLGDGIGSNPETLHRPQVVDAGPVQDGPAPVLTTVTQVTAGGGQSCFRLSNGRVRCAGTNTSGQIGNPAVGAGSHWPVVVKDGTGTGPLAGVAQVVAGGSHTCARLATGGVRCWGANLAGQLGDGGGPGSDLPVVVEVP